LAGCLVGLAFLLQVVVVCEVTRGLFDSTLRFVDVAFYLGHGSSREILQVESCRGCGSGLRGAVQTRSTRPLAGNHAWGSDHLATRAPRLRIRGQPRAQREIEPRPNRSLR